MATLTAEKRADAIEDSRVCKSPLAGSYPCDCCAGDGYVEDWTDADELVEVDCPECHGSGADQFAKQRHLVERATLIKRGSLNLMSQLRRNRDESAVSEGLVTILKDLLARSIAGEDVERELMKQLDA